MAVKQCIRVFPHFVISNISEWREKKSVISSLKERFTSSNKPRSFLRFFLLASPENRHDHSTNALKATERIDPLLVKKIYRVVSDGISSVRDIKMLLENYVDRMFEEYKPDRMNTAFFPSEEIIYTHMYNAIYLSKKTVIDQEALANQIQDWKQTSPTDLFHFRPYASNDDGTQPLIFCYQANWQQELMKKYGSVMLLDATYKTTMYSLPLFFLTLKTNVGYIVVGIFVIQSENSKLIQEALQVFKDWNEAWKPVYWLTDFSESEINAIETIFPNSTVYLCKFHREQAWIHWVRKQGNLQCRDDGEEVLRIWREISCCETDEAVDEKLRDLKNNPVFLRNEKAMDYLEKQWLTHRHRWIDAFRPKEDVAYITTTNGVEAMNKVLKYAYLKHSSDKTLTGMLKVVINSYLPEIISKYWKKNLQYKMYNEEVPHFLHGKCPSFIKHVMKRYSAAQLEFTRNCITVMDEGIFCVQSAGKENKHYIVNFSEATCTCCDFCQWRYPCKHVCAVFIFIPEWSFDKLNERYRLNPLICLHASLSSGDCSGANLEEEPMLDEPQQSTPVEENGQALLKSHLLICREKAKHALICHIIVRMLNR